MNPEVKEKFVAALRSGEYNKAVARLYRYQDGQHCYCALGVLCDIALKEGVDGLVFDPNDDVQLLFFRGPEARDDDMSFGYRSGILPTVVKDWAGLEDFDAHRVYVKNDSSDYTFPEIADWVEMNL